MDDKDSKVLASMIEVRIFIESTGVEHLKAISAFQGCSLAASPDNNSGGVPEVITKLIGNKKLVKAETTIKAADLVQGELDLGDEVVNCAILPSSTEILLEFK